MKITIALTLLVCTLAAACSSAPPLRPSTFDMAGPTTPPTAQTLRAMARLCFAQGRDEDGERTLERLISEYPDFAPAYNDLAELHLRNERREEAAAALKLGLARAPADSVLLNNLGMCELQRGSPERALEHFASAASSSPGDARYRANMALALGMAGRTDEAFALYSQVVSEADAHDNMAVVFTARGELSRAERARQVAADLRAVSKH